MTNHTDNARRCFDLLTTQDCFASQAWDNRNAVELVKNGTIIRLGRFTRAEFESALDMIKAMPPKPERVEACRAMLADPEFHHARASRFGSDNIDLYRRDRTSPTGVLAMGSFETKEYEAARALLPAGYGRSCGPLSPTEGR